MSGQIMEKVFLVSIGEILKKYQMISKNANNRVFYRHHYVINLRGNYG